MQIQGRDNDRPAAARTAVNQEVARLVRRVARFQPTLDYVREQRGMAPEEYETLPTPAMMELAYAILEEVRVSGRPLFPIS